jgi:hypothetical protein
MGDLSTGGAGGADGAAGAGGAGGAGAGDAGAAGAAAGPVDEYLDRLFDLLAGTGAAGRRALGEVADHLQASTAADVAGGLSRVEAERAAVHRFGPAEQVARGLRAPVPVGFALRRLSASAAVLGSVGLVAVGLSGLAAAALGAAFGKAFVSGDAPGGTYTAARCADYLEYYPNAGSCRAAAVAHHFDEVVQYRAAAGVLGLLVLVAFWGLRRYGPLAGPAWAPRPDLVAVAGAGAFAGGAVFFGGTGSMQLLSGLRDGAGQFLSAGLVSVLALAVFGPLLARQLRRQPIRHLAGLLLRGH